MVANLPLTHKKLVGLSAVFGKLTFGSSWEKSLQFFCSGYTPLFVVHVHGSDFRKNSRYNTCIFWLVVVAVCCSRHCDGYERQTGSIGQEHLGH